jgi:hypothetical protein
MMIDVIEVFGRSVCSVAQCYGMCRWYHWTARSSLGNAGMTENHLM